MGEIYGGVVWLKVKMKMADVVGMMGNVVWIEDLPLGGGNDPACHHKGATPTPLPHTADKVR